MCPLDSQLNLWIPLCLKNVLNIFKLYVQKSKLFLLLLFNVALPLVRTMLVTSLFPTLAFMSPLNIMLSFSVTLSNIFCIVSWNSSLNSSLSYVGAYIPNIVQCPPCIFNLGSVILSFQNLQCYILFDIDFWIHIINPDWPLVYLLTPL